MSEVNGCSQALMPSKVVANDTAIKDGTSSQRAIMNTWKRPPSAWTPRLHSQAEKVGRDVEEYFLQNWDFPNQDSKARFLKAGFPRVTCLYFPLAKDDRIEYACRLLTVLFLIDGQNNVLYFTYFVYTYRIWDTDHYYFWKISWKRCL